MAGLKFDITGDNSNMLSALQGVQNGVRQTQRVVEQSGGGIEQMFGRIQTAATAAVGAFSVKELGSKVLNIRGQFQQLEVAFTTMLGSASEANRLMDQLIKTAAVTPFDLQGVANGAKQLLAYGIQADHVNETLMRLGDIAAGLSIPLGDLVYLYGTTMVQGRMFTMDLRQFQGRGVPIADELAKQFGVAKEKVSELVTAGKVGAEEFNKAIVSMTSEGGKFAGLMENQSRTITGQISNIEDAIDTMFNDIGKKSEGVINSGLGAVSYLVEHWEEVGKVVLEVAIAYGSYKAALLAVYAAHKAQAIIETVSAFFSLTKSVSSAKDAMLLFNMITKANPIGLIVGIIASAAAAFYLFSKNTDAATKAQESLGKIQEEAAGKAAEEKTKIDLLVAAAKNDKLAMEERKKAVQRLNAIIPNYNAQLDATTGRYRENKEALDDYLKSLTRKYEIEGAKDKLAEIGRKKAEAKSRLNKDLKDSEKGGFSHDNDIVGGAFAAAVEGGRGAVTVKEARIARKKAIVSNFKRDMEEIKAEENAILSSYGNDLQKDAVSTPKASSRGADKSIQEQKKELQDELNALSYREAAGKKGAALRKRIRELQEKEKVYSPSYEASQAKKNKEIDKINDEIAERNKAIKDYEKSVFEQQNETEFALRQQNIDLKEESFEKEVEQIKFNYDRLIAENKKRRKEMIEALKDNKVNEWLNQNPKATKAQQIRYRDALNLTDADLSKKQKAQLEEYDRIANEQQSKATSKLLKKQQAALYEYLKEYGSIQEKRLAIAKEYDEKIAQAQSEGERLSLNAQKAKALSDFDLTEEKKNLNWEDIFGDLTNQTIGQLEKVKAKLREMLNSDNLSVEGYKTAVEQIEKVNNAIIDAQDKQRSFFDFSTSYSKERRKLEMDVADALQRQADAIANQKNAHGKVWSKQIGAGQLLSNYGVNHNGDITASKTGEILKEVEKKYGTDSEAYKKVRDAMEDLAASERELIEANEKKKNADSSVVKSQGKLDNFLGDLQGKLKGFGESFDMAMSNLNSLPDLLSELGVSAESSVMKGVKDLAEAGNAAQSAMKDFMSGNFIGAVSNGIQAFKSLGSSIGHFFSGDNDKEVRRTTERLTASNKELAKRIDSLSDTIGSSAGAKAVNAYDTALKAQKEINKNNMDILKAQMRNYGKHHSNSYYANDRIISSYNKDAQLAFKAAGVDSANITGLDSIYSLSPEQLNAIRNFAPNLWKYLTEVGKNDKKEYWDAVVEQAGKTEKLTEQIKNNLTQTSFDSLRSGFLDTLMNMDADAEDWSNNFSKMLFRSMVNKSILNDGFDKWLKDFQNKWADKVNSGKMSQADYAAYRDEYNNKMMELKNQTNNLASSVGYSDASSSQKATANGVSSITFEQANNIVALTTAGNISRDQIKDLVASVMTTISSMAFFSSSTNTAVLEIRNLMIYNNSYLEDILKCSKSIYADFSKKIDDVNKNLKDMK